MKKFTLFASMMLLMASFAVAQGQGPGPGPGGPPQGPPPPTKVVLAHTWDTRPVAYTLDVLTVIDAKCLGCHNANARSNNAKRALQWEKLQEASAAEALATLDSIKRVVGANEMPPARMVERNPDAALTETEKSTLLAWIDEMVAKLEN